MPKAARSQVGSPRAGYDDVDALKAAAASE